MNNENSENSDEEYEDDKIENICPILFIQMELCDFTLKEYIQSTMINDDVEKRISYFKQILYGVKYLHDSNIIHRDIKPANIFFTKKDDYIVKVGDFGISKLINTNTNKQIEQNIILESVDNMLSKYEFTDLTLLTSYIGTGIYAAPETKSNSYDSSIDIYSLGIILIELLLDTVKCTTMYEKYKIIDSIKTKSENIDKCDLISHNYDNIIKKMICNSENRINVTELIDII
jgi:serine/threonine protein kinase